MAIKFYRAKALPSSLNSSHDGVWFVKPDGATSFRTYNVKDGVAVGDGFDLNADYLQGKYQSGLYSTLRGQYEDYGFTGIYDRTVTTDADLRGGGVNIDIIEGSCNYAQDPNILIDANATGSGLLLTDCTPDLKIDVIIDNGSQASAHGHALWQAFFQNRHASEQYAYFSSIKVYVSLDGSSWSTVPNDGWSVDDFNPRVAAYGPAGFWFSRSGTPSPEWQWRYVKFEFRNIVFGTHSTNPDRSYFKALGIRHASEQYARQYLTERRAKGLFDEKVDKTDSRLNDSREWTASTVSQSEAQAGTSTTRRAWTALRVRQAITAWWDTIADKIAEKAWVSANFDKYGFWNLKTNGVQRKTIQAQNDVDFVAGDNIGISYGADGKVIIDANGLTPTLAQVTARGNVTESIMFEGDSQPDLLIQASSIVKLPYPGQHAPINQAIIFHEDELGLVQDTGAQTTVITRGLYIKKLQNASQAGAGFSNCRVKADPAENQNELPVWAQVGVTTNIRRDSSATVTLLEADSTIICDGGGSQVINTNNAVPGRIYRILSIDTQLEFEHEIYFADGSVYNQFDTGTVLQIQYEQQAGIWWEVSGNPLPM